jgi:hypothetical protein
VTPRQARIALFVIAAFTAARVATTYRVFSQTSDENIHLAAGYDLLKKHTWMTDVHHPPLARVFFALPFVDTPEASLPWERVARGNALLCRDGRYTRNLAEMRFGNLLFLIIGILAVARWTTRLWSREAGVVAAALFAMVPVVLAHAGLATTDLAVAALLPLALDECSRLVEHPGWKRSVTAGLAVAAGVLSKFSFLPYFPVAMAVILAVALVRDWRSLLRARLALWIAVAIVICVAGVWAGFGFSFEPLIAGLKEVRLQNTGGHRAFLFGEVRWIGWWYYFPVALFFKTPIPFLLLAAGGCIFVARRRPEVPLVALTMLGVAMSSHINIGIRHLMPIYAPLAMAAAMAVVELRRMRIASALLLIWLFADGALAHPDYLPWFNGFARDAAAILNDSNLDWGQDVLRLVRYARRERLPFVSVLLFTSADLDCIGLPPHENVKEVKPIHGWFAISEMEIAIGMSHSEKVRAWLEHLIGGRPYTRIGKTIRLYKLPER